jgi:dGTPase
VASANLRGAITGVAADGELRQSRFSGATPPKNDHRTGAERDRDRILYSWQWRRLAGVTQVISPFDDGHLLHNRLTHSEKVAQVSRSIATTLLADPRLHDLMVHLGGFDVFVCEAAAMAHDMGHPPFGHIGETVLDRLALDPNVLALSDGFEGNAQTFRIIATGRARSLNYEGLDVTAATLAAVAKYPWKRVMKLDEADHKTQLDSDPKYRREWRKFSAYRPEEGLLQWARQFAPNIGDRTQTLEASVMDVADDITYAVHDLEDFYFARVLDVAGVIEDLYDTAGSVIDSTPFQKLADRLALDYVGYYDLEMFRSAAKRVAAQLLQGFEARQRPAPAQREARARATTSDLIGRYINAVELAEEPLWVNGPHIGLRRAEWHEVQILKEITKVYVISGTDMALLQRGQEEVLTNLVVMLQKWADHDMARLPPRLREEIETAKSQDSTYVTNYYQRPGAEAPGLPADLAPRGEENRAILDYICSLSDAQCQALFQKLSGHQVHRGGIDFTA